MTSGRPWGAARVAALVEILRSGIVMTILLLTVLGLVVPDVFAYNEAMSELWVGSNPPLIVQNQSYSTSTRQTLFHQLTNAAADTEAFDFAGNHQDGISLGQTVSSTVAGTETGYFMSTASYDLVPPVHIGNGFLGTKIDDPLETSAPFFAGLILPQMTTMDQGEMATQMPGIVTAATNPATAGNATGNKTQKTLNLTQPDPANDLNVSLSNLSTTNITSAANATKQNATPKNATSKPAATRSPVIAPGQVFYHQQNKPFSAELTSPSGPFKATPAQIQNTSGFDRFLMNTVGRSTTDKAFNGTTSSPTYITPDKALAAQIPYDYIQGARGMTMPGTHLNYRAWPL